MNPLHKFGVYGGYGLISTGRRRPVTLGADLDPALRLIDWSRCFLPTYNQRGPSCASEASSNIVEAMLRFFQGLEAFAPGEQIDGYAVHKVVCDMFNDGDLQQGAMLNWPFKAMLKMGIIPPDTKLVEVEPTLAGIVSALQNGPVLQGLWVGPGWSDANSKNGQIPENWRIDTSDPAQGGHATAIVAYEPRNGSPWVRFVNQWGMKFGWHGTGVISWQEWSREHAPIGDGPYQFRFNEHSMVSWQGHRKFVINVRNFAKEPDHALVEK